MSESLSRPLPARPPRRNLETTAFWDACAAGQFTVPRCDSCSEYFWYPRGFCPFCGGQSVTFTPTDGHGTIYSFTVVRRGEGAFREASPYVIAIVELAEGPRLMTNILTDDPPSISVGQAVRVVLQPAGDDGDRIYRFAPVA